MNTTKNTKIVLFGILIWLIMYAIKNLIFHSFFYGTIFVPWFYGTIIVVFLIIYFKKATGQYAQDSIRIGLIWFAINGLLDTLINTGMYVQTSQVFWNGLVTFVLSVSVGFLFKYGYIFKRADSRKKNVEPHTKTDSRKFDSGFFKYIPTFANLFYRFVGPSPRRRFFRVGASVAFSFVTTVLFVPIFFVSSTVGYEVFRYPEFGCYYMVCSPNNLRGWLITLLLYLVFYYIVFRVYKFFKSLYTNIKKSHKID